METILIRTDPVYKEMHSCFDCPYFVKIDEKDQNTIGRCKHPDYVIEMSKKYGEVSYWQLIKLITIKIWDLYNGFPKYCKLDYISEKEPEKERGKDVIKL